MKCTNLLFIVCIGLFVLTSCSRKGDPTPIVVKPKTVYIGGITNDPTTGQSSPTYWTATGEMKQFAFDYVERVNAITVSGPDVYLAGSTNASSYATYWQNGVKTQLTTTEWHSSATGIAILGSDVYLPATIDQGYPRVPVLWKNDVMTKLADAGWTGKMITSGEDIYIAANIYKDPQPSYAYAGYWKNGVPTYFENFYQATDITVTGSDVYVAGIFPTQLGGVPLYWKNGVVTRLTNVSSSKIAQTYTAPTIVVSGSDVYVAASVYELSSQKYFAAYWKNGEFNQLSTSASSATGLVVLGTDVYVSGFLGDPASTVCTAVYWKNGVITVLSDQWSIAKAIIAD